MRYRRQKRRGAALIIALVCVVILGFLLTAILRFALVQRRASTLQLNEAQATCLADSGLRRAAARLMIDPDYQGETWSPSWDLSPESLEEKQEATVTIEVQKTDEANTRLIKVTADYPKPPARHRVRIAQEITIKLNTEIKNQEK